VISQRIFSFFLIFLLLSLLWQIGPFLSHGLLPFAGVSGQLSFCYIMMLAPRPNLNLEGREQGRAILGDSEGPTRTVMPEEEKE